jgi:Cytochrome c7 and related cytochrome c
MRRSWTWTLLLAGALLTTGCGTFFGFGPPQDEIKSPHERHKKGDVECLACHESIFDSESLTTVDLPKEAKCFECHKEEKANKQCDFCHTQPATPATHAVKPRHLLMSHKQHLDMKELSENCVACHTTLPEPGKRVEAPPMEACLKCHEHQEQFDQGRCDVCHQDLGLFALRPISSFAHQGDFLKGHAQLARSRPASCATCHDQSYCTDCHAKTVSASIEVRFPEAVDRLSVHRGNFLGRHSIEQRADPVLCARCHSVSYCTDCHTRTGLTPVGSPGLSPHGSGINDKASPEFHGTQARRDILSCAACHDQGAQSNCVSCHRVGGIGGNPHPTSWLARHHNEEISQNAMCLTCHR